MDKFKELEKYKELYDSGAITEEEFRKIKQSFLGLPTDEEREAQKQQERDAALAEIEKMKEQAAIKEAETICTAQEKEPEHYYQDPKAQYQTTTQAEKKDEFTRSKVEQETTAGAKTEQPIQTRNTTRKSIGVVSKIFLWLVSLFCLFLAIGCFSSENSALNICAGIIFLLLSVLACPFVTSRTKNIKNLSVFYRVKKFVVIGLVVLLLILMTVL